MKLLVSLFAFLSLSIAANANPRLDLSVNVRNNQIELNWNIAEFRFKRFVVERSFDGLNFEYVRSFAAGNQSRFFWAEPATETRQYFRIRYMLENNETGYSSSVEAVKTSPELSLSSIKADRELVIWQPAGVYTATILISHITGQPAELKNVRREAGQTRISVSHLKRGMYQILLTDSQGRSRKLNFIKG